MKTKILALLLTGISVQSCITNRQILLELRSYKAQQDSILLIPNFQLQDEKERIKSEFKDITDDALLREIERLTRPKPKNER